MKKRAFKFMVLLMFFICLISIPRLPLIPETITTVSAEKTDILKVVENLPRALLTDEWSQTFSGTVAELFSKTPDSVTGFPGATYKADYIFATWSYRDLNISLSGEDIYLDHYVYIPAKFSGTVYGTRIRYIGTFEDSATGFKFSTGPTWDGNFYVSSSALDAEGRCILRIRLFIDGTTKLYLRIYYYNVSSNTFVQAASVSCDLGYDTLLSITFDIDQLYFLRDPITMYVTADHEVGEDYILHHVTVPSYAHGASITVYKPSSWSFYNITPSATVTEYSDRIEITNTVEGDYDIYFTSTDFWNYPRRYDTRISYFDQKGDYIPFESVFTYYNLSWSEVKPTYEPLYSDIFTMDPAQYLSIKVLDRWGNVLLEEGNLTYQEFYNFTLTMYTFQVYSFQDDFVYVKIRKTGTTDWYGQHLAPNEALKLRLYPTDYDLQVTFPNGTTISDTFTLNNDTAYLISGYTLTKLVGLVVVSMVRYFDPLGLPLSFEEFKTYYNVSSQPIAAPK
ncbi:MAG: hypothetical protein J7K17_06675, partial [Candidatus Omnitrophica bacterium]|nr:hypothetical protein [Candidatus Omnitrophota bacterium]